MTTEYTDGPWEAVKSYGKPGRYEIRSVAPSPGCSFGYAPLAYVQGDRRTTGADGKANALLMSAAPDLLEALRDARHCIATDRDGLLETERNPSTGEVEPAAQNVINEYDDLLARIDEVISKACGGAA